MAATQYWSAAKSSKYCWRCKWIGESLWSVLKGDSWATLFSAVIKALAVLIKPSSEPVSMNLTEGKWWRAGGWRWLSAPLQSEETRHSQQWHHLVVGRGALWTEEKQEHDASQKQVTPATFVSRLRRAPCQIQYLLPAPKIPRWSIVCGCAWWCSVYLICSNVMFLSLLFERGTRTGIYTLI